MMKKNFWKTISVEVLRERTVEIVSCTLSSRRDMKRRKKRTIRSKKLAFRLLYSPIESSLCHPLFESFQLSIDESKG